MKEKLGTVWGLIKHYKKILIALLVVIVAVIVVVNVLAIKQRKYEEKVEGIIRALSKESKMKQLIEDGTIDLKGAVAWQNAMDNYDVKMDDFEKELKKVKKDDDSIDDMKEGLIEFAKNGEGSRYKIRNIEKLKKNSKNRKVSIAEIELEDFTCAIVFYNGKIIDVINNDSYKVEDNGEVTNIFSVFRSAYK